MRKWKIALEDYKGLHCFCVDVWNFATAKGRRQCSLTIVISGHTVIDNLFINRLLNRSWCYHTTPSFGRSSSRCHNRFPRSAGLGGCRLSSSSYSSPDRAVEGGIKEACYLRTPTTRPPTTKKKKICFSIYIFFLKNRSLLKLF